MNKKRRIITGLTFGIIITIFSILQGLLTQDHLTTKNIAALVFSSLLAGAAAGFLFGWIMALFANSNFVRQSTKIETNADETIIFETGANHFKGYEGVGGKLYLTNKRLVFKSHKFNIQNHELSIDLSHIDKVNLYKTFGIVGNGFAVATTENTIEKFAVQQPQEWLKQLTERNNLQPEHI